MYDSEKIQRLAGELYAALETLKNDDGDIVKRDGVIVWRLKDGSPQWMTDVVYACHESGDMLPDDWRYDFINEVAGALAEEHWENVDVESDVYNHDLTQWIASRIDRAYYCDQAIDELGYDPRASTMDRLSFGQYYEKVEVKNALVAALDEVDDLDECADCGESTAPGTPDPHSCV